MLRHRHILPNKSTIHSGTRRLRAYNDDQRKVIDELKKRPEYDQNDFYLFFVDDIEKLDDDGNPTRDIIGGYMPIGWHFGFIYNNPRTAYIAHELGHGVLTMHHTFAEESETFHAPKESSDNLMDYNGGTLLNHKQWQWAHEKHSREWFEEEEEGEMIIENVIVVWTQDHSDKPQNLYNKANLRFVKIGRMKGNDPTNSLFYKMEDGSVIREFDVVSDYYSTDYTERKFEILLPEFTEPIPFYLDKHKSLNFSDDLSFINHKLTQITGTVIARYVLPIEDVYIIFEGKDFDDDGPSVSEIHRDHEDQHADERRDQEHRLLLSLVFHWYQLLFSVL